MRNAFLSKNGFFFNVEIAKIIKKKNKKTKPKQKNNHNCGISPYLNENLKVKLRRIFILRIKTD